MSETNRERWGRRVGEWKRSGLTAREYAARAGLNAGTLSYWKWRLSRDTKPVKQRVTAGPARGALLELAPVALSDERVEVELASGHRLRVPAGFDAASLGRLLWVLQERP
jgi:transposase